LTVRVRRPHLNAVTVGLIAYVWWDAKDVPLTPWHYILALLVGAAGVVALLLRLPRLRLPGSLAAVLPGWLLLSLLSVVVSIHNGGSSMLLMTTTFALSLLPVVLTCAGLVKPQLFSERSVRTLLVGLFVGAVVAWLYGRHRVRYDAPDALLIAGAWCWFAEKPGRRRLAVAAVLLLLSYYSGYRTAIVVWCIAGGIVLWKTGLASRFAIVSAVIALVVVVVAGYIPFHTLVQGSGSRAADFAGTDQDVSIETRLDELRDVRRAIGNWAPHEWLVGEGHGGTYEPDKAYYSSNILKETGRIHQIHNGPALIFFRYGLVGLGFLLALVVATWRTLQSITSLRIGTALMPLGCLLYLLTFLTLNVTLTPVFAYVISGTLLQRYSPSFAHQPHRSRARRQSPMDRAGIS